MEEKNSIEKIALKKKNFKGEDTEVSINSLLEYKNLKRCNLFHFYITDENIDVLNQLINLKFIKFDFCYFNLKELNLKSNITEISFNLCENLRMQHLGKIKAEKIEIIQLEKNNIKIDLSELEYCENLKELSVHNCQIKGIEKLLEKAPNIKKVNFDGSIVENKSFLVEIKKKINFSNKEKFYLANA